MFTYFYRIFDGYEQEITALAIYTGTKVPTNYSEYKYNFLGTENTYKFNTYQIRQAKERDLIKSNNPFSLVVLATKYLHKTKEDDKKRYSFKRKLVRLAKDKSYTNSQIISLLKFIDIILELPENLERKFIDEVISTFIKPEDMQTLNSEHFSNQLHLALYGETFQDRLKRELIAEKTEAVEKILKETNLSVDSISKILKLSKETVLTIKPKVEKKK